MQTVLTRFKCWRHSKGFGIHSPFAFRFVTEVLCQPLHYYAYSRIGRDRRLRLLFRLVLAFRPGTVAVLSAQPDKLRLTAALPSSALKFASPGCADMLIVDADDVLLAEYIPHIAAGAHALVLNGTRQTTRAIREAMPSGMTFDNRCGTLVVAAYPHLPRQDFDVMF